jgi:hypothetical protein
VVDERDERAADWAGSFHPVHDRATPMHDVDAAGKIPAGHVTLIRVVSTPRTSPAASPVVRP